MSSRLTIVSLLAFGHNILLNFYCKNKLQRTRRKTFAIFFFSGDSFWLEKNLMLRSLKQSFENSLFNASIYYRHVIRKI